MTPVNVTVIQPTIIIDTTRIRVAAYCRVSSDSSDQLNSYMTQIRYFEKAISESEDEEFVGIYADEGITGTRIDKRNEFLRLMKDCRRGKIDRIITKSISRFSRNTKECLTCVRELTELGITVMFEKEGIDTAEMSDEMLITIMGGLAQEESTSISQNLQWSIKKRMQNGNYIASSVPFGYKLKNNKLYIDKNEAEIVNQIFDDFLSGKGAKKIAQEYNKKSLENGFRWCSSTIQYILTNEKYIGDSIWQKTYTPNTIPFKSIINKGVIDRYYITNTHKAIIDKFKYEAVQQLVISKRTNNYTAEIYPLSLKIKCGNCSTTYRRKKCNEKVYWVCRKHTENLEDCPSKQIPELLFYSAFMSLYNKLKQNHNTLLLPLLIQLQDLKNKKFNCNINVIEINKEIAKHKEQIHVLTRLKTKGFLNESKYLEQSGEINTKIHKLTNEMQKITRCDDEDELIDQIKEIASMIEGGPELISEFDEVMFESLVEKIIVNNQTELEFHIYGGLVFRENIYYI